VASHAAPTADLRFRRTEQVVVERVLDVDVSATARLLDRSGAASSMPVDITERSAPDGRRWVGVSVSLAPLAPGEYAIEVSAPEDAGGRSVVAIRVTP
jgi:hypothetical protein